MSLSPEDLRRSRVVCSHLRFLGRKERQTLSNSFSNAHATLYRGMGWSWLIARVRPAFRRDDQQYYVVNWGGSNDWDRLHNDENFQQLTAKGQRYGTFPEILSKLYDQMD